MNRNIFYQNKTSLQDSDISTSSDSESSYYSSDSDSDSDSDNVKDKKNHNERRKYNPDVMEKFKGMTKIDESGRVLRKQIKYNFTNSPYKTIIKDKKLKKVKDAKDFEINIGTKPSKDEINKQVDVKQNEREYSDDERKVAYSADKFSKHKKYFDQRNREIFRVNYANDDHYNLKGDTIKFLEQQQKLLEEGKKTQNEIFEFLQGSDK